MTTISPQSSPTLQSAYDAWHGSHLLQESPRREILKPWHRLVKDYLGDVSGLRILEVACGQGGFVRELWQLGADVTGCDFSAVALWHAWRILETPSVGGAPRLVQGDIQRLPFADRSFDAVVDCETIEHVPDDLQALREMFRITRPGGKLFLTTPNYLNFIGAYDLYSRMRRGQRLPDQPFDRLQWFVSVRQKIQDVGWSILKTDGAVHQFPFFPGRNPATCELFERSRVVRKLLSPFALHFFVMAKKPA